MDWADQLAKVIVGEVRAGRGGGFWLCEDDAFDLIAARLRLVKVEGKAEAFEQISKELATI